MVNINKILAPTDCSEPSSNALLYAFEISKTFNADLVVLKVFDPPVSRRPMETGFSVSPEYDPAQQEQEQMEEIKSFWNHLIPGGAQPVFTRLIGDPFNEIIQYSKQHSVDMIIMGTHGYTGFDHILMGSVAEKVVRHSVIPVLTVKQKSFEYRREG